MPKDFDIIPDFQPGQIEIAPIPMFGYAGNLTTEMAASLPRRKPSTARPHAAHPLL